MNRTRFAAFLFAALVAAFIGLRSLHQVKRQAKATEETATAANNNALAVINSERAWVFADIEPTIGHHGRFVNTETGETSIYARLNCRNVGRTPAWIFEVRMRFMFVRADEIPAMPPLKEAEPIWAGTHPMAPKDEPFSTGDNTLTAKGVQGIDSVTGERALVYGVVYYRDIYEKVRSTTFGYRLMPGTDTRFTRLINYPKYNEGT